MATSVGSRIGGGGMSLGKTQPVSRNQEATIYIGNLDEAATESLLYELFVQAGPVVHVHIPRDRITQAHQGYGFVEFQSEEDADYAIKIMNGIRLHGKVLRINRSSQDKKTLDVGANLFVGNLAPDADEKVLFDTFIMFGRLIETPKVARDETTGVSRGYAFISYDAFDASDAAIEAMNGQYLCNRPITVNYAFKKDGKGERHGTAAERLLAAQNRQAAMAAGGANQSAVSPSMPPQYLSPNMPYGMPAPMPGTAYSNYPPMGPGMPLTPPTPFTHPQHVQYSQVQQSQPMQYSQMQPFQQTPYPHQSPYPQQPPYPLPLQYMQHPQHMQYAHQANPNHPPAP